MVPTPVDGVVDVSYPVSLSWTAPKAPSAGAMSYRVLLDRIDPPVAALWSGADTSCNSGTLDPLTQYYWRVVVIDGDDNESNGPVWSFTTAIDDLVLIPAGTFTMGSPATELGRDDDEVQHEVTLTRAFYMSPCEVTEELWDRVMGSGTSTSRLPKVQMTWYEALEFCNALSAERGLTPCYAGADTSWTWDQSADGYRLPTEAEWEYASRAGSATAFANGPITATYFYLDPNLDAMGWYGGNSGTECHEVGGKQANAWGLHDMHGSVFEWCWDRFGYYAGSAIDPEGPDSGEFRVIRGGSWFYYAQACRSANREVYPAAVPGDYTGFRVVRSAF